MGPGRGGGHPFGGDDTGPTKPVGAALPLLRRATHFFGPYRGRLAVIGIAILGSSILGLANPYLLKLLIDEAIPKRDIGLLAIYAGLMVIVPIINGGIGLAQAWLTASVGQFVMRDLRNALFTHVQSMPIRFFAETRTGEIQSRLTNDVSGVQSVVSDAAANLASSIAVVLSTLVAMTLIDWRLTAVSLSVAPIFLYFTSKASAARRKASAEVQGALADLTSIAEEHLSVGGALLAKSFGRAEAGAERFTQRSGDLATLQLRQALTGRWVGVVVQVVFSGIPALVYFVAGTLAATGAPDAPTIGDIVAFTTLQSRLFFPLASLLGLQVEIGGSLALFERIFAYLDLVPEIVDAPDAAQLQRASVRGGVELRNVSFRYPQPPGADTSARRDTFALQEISFSAEPGSLTALVGPSGSGKSTILSLIPRFWDTKSGSVLIDGRDVRQIKLSSLGEMIGVVTQETHLLHASIGDNLRYARPDATDEQLWAALQGASLDGRVHELPQGLETIVGERGYKLSGGERQRLAIARVLLKDPPILLLDEATSALDSVSERHVQEALERAMNGRTTIAVAHRLSTVASADQILVLDHGVIVERGRHDELRRAGGLYASLAAMQFGVTKE
ncbi:MAG: ABC transporter ATP-binding protein [Chloroflexi bacterium]|nr:ABC transporter ATP-binding protein [Chloroflexota bacterium]